MIMHGVEETPAVRKAPGFAPFFPGLSFLPFHQENHPTRAQSTRKNFVDFFIDLDIVFSEWR
jgi:hypothetical protein